MSRDHRDEVSRLRDRLTDAEDELRRGEEAFAALFEASLDAIFWADGETGEIVRCNPAAERLTGRPREELLGSHQTGLHPPDKAEHFSGMFREHLERGGFFDDEAEVLTASGEVVPVHITATVTEVGGRPLVQGVFRDLTERRRAEAQRERLEQRVQQAERMESLGLLAGGIAHDFNNLLMGVMGNTGLAQQNLPEGAAARPFVEQIEVATRRAAELTNQLLAYAGRGRLTIRPLDLSALVREQAHLLQTVVARDARLVLEPAEHGPFVAGDAAQLRQVVMNLITNASDALCDGPGTITVATAEAALTREDLDGLLLGEDGAPGTYAVVEVSDTGCGMDPHTATQIFDPFFTTKVAGRGLGLASVLGIVRSHRGALAVESEPGMGTTVRVVLPRTDEREVEVAEAPGPAAGDEIGGLVLVVDDEPIVRETVELILAEAGFEALTAADGEQAVAHLRDRADEVSVVLLDLTMPGMSGEQTFRALREIRAEVPVILTSGYDPDDAAGRLGPAPADAFIQKPYTPDQLIGVIRSVVRKTPVSMY